MALKFKMLPDVFLSHLTARGLTELKAYFQLEYEDQQKEELARKARAGAKERMRMRS